MKTKERYIQYSQKSIVSKVNPEFIGIANSYNTIKKQRIVSQQLLQAASHQFSTIQKINKSLQKTINRKRNQLKFAQKVRNRYIEDNEKKQKFITNQSNQLNQLRNKNNEERYKSMVRLVKVRQDLSNKKRQEANNTRQQVNRLEMRKRMQDSQLWETKNSRVREVESEKKRINDYCNRFFQNKNKKFLQNYKDLMSRQKEKEARNIRQMKNLENKLVVAQEKASLKQRLLKTIDHQIEQIKGSGNQSMKSSRYQSTCSMTPLELLSTKSGKKTSEKKSEEKVKFKLILN